MSETIDTQRDDIEMVDQHLTDWKNAPNLSDLKQDLEEASPAHANHTTQVKIWLDNLHIEGAAKIAEKTNRSSVVPKVIRKQAEWRYAALTEPFLSTPDVYNIEPITFEDTKAARQNQLLLNNQFNTKIGKNQFIDDYVRTAVDEGTVICRTGWEEEVREITTQEPVFGYRPNEAFMEVLNHMIQLSHSAPDKYDLLPQHMKTAIAKSVQANTPMEPFRTGETQEMTKQTIVKNNPTVDVCDFNNVILDPTCYGDIDKARFAVYSFDTSLAELRAADIYENLDAVQVKKAESALSTSDHNADVTVNTFIFQDEPRKRIVAYEYWGFWDIHGTGLVEPIVATWVGNTLIRMEENPYPDRKIPFVKVQYLPVRRENYGEPDGALLEDNQKIIGAVTRGMVDIMARSANGQVGTRKDALDTTNRRLFRNGEDYEFNSVVDPRMGFYMHKFEEIPQSAPLMLNMQNAEAESLTGVKTYATDGISGASLGDTAALGRSAMDAASKRELGILRRLADGVTQIGRKFIAMNAEFLSEKEVIRVTNEDFVEVRRDDLAGNFDMSLSISTAEEDNSKAAELSFMLQTVGPNSDPKITFMIMADIARLRKMPDLAKRLDEFQPQPDPMAMEKAQLENQLLQAQIAAEMAKPGAMDMKAKLDQAKITTEAAKAEELQSQADLNSLDFVEKESGTTQERDLEKQGAQANANAQLEMVKALVNGRDEPAGK